MSTCKGFVILVLAFAALPGYAFGFYEPDAKEMFKKMESEVREFRRAFHETSRMNQRINLIERFAFHS